MPELTLLCGSEEHVCTAVSVRMYRKYTEFMEHNNGSSAQDAFAINAEILKEFFGISSRELRKAEVEEQLVAAKTIHFVVQEIITKKFLELNPDRPEQQEKSIFDEYDEENGYNEGEKAENVWKVCRENLDRVVKLCIRAFNDSYTKCMESDIMSLIDYVVFEIATINENK